ncbi:hypothetical protein VTN31DRAFT_3322 [Thermomyces dupontii]|uniref:uncharacterized protein n=1 Tax=Talaromyces thermophilus TaxID=28565 RepID=UPI0037433DF8
MGLSPASLNPPFQSSAPLSAPSTDFPETPRVNVDISGHYIQSSGSEDIDLGYGDILDMYLVADPPSTDTPPMHLMNASWRGMPGYLTFTTRSPSSISPVADSSNYDTRSSNQRPDDPGRQRLVSNTSTQESLPERVKHSRSNSPTKLGYRCHICGLLFTRRANCREHIKRHDPNHQKEHYVCEKCGKSVSRKTDLKRHYLSKIHNDKKQFHCDLCGRSYARQDTLIR